MSSPMTVTVFIRDRMTRTQKIMILLRDYPEIRDSYDLIVERYYKHYPNDWVKRTTIERDARHCQYDVGVYPPSEETRKLRRTKQKEIIAEKKKGWWGKVFDLFKF